MKRLGLDYDACQTIRPDLIYGAISGYGHAGPWRDKPGQDLLVQALSGLTWLSGNAGDGPVPMGLAIVDIFAGAQLAQGILAALLRRTATGRGGLVKVDMLSSVLDFQVQALTLYLQDAGREPVRTAGNNAEPHLSAPAGIYETADGHLALATGQIPLLGRLLGCPDLLQHSESANWHERRDQLKVSFATQLRTRSTADWLAVLEQGAIHCAEVLDWNRLMTHEAYRVLGFEQTVCRGDGFTYRTTRCPIRLNGERLYAERGSPDIGEHNQKILRELAT
jgi:crotonobetainyl-CoA:carnitine CoA-transferase CaiB-like acyl-CoA transferase